MLSQIQPHFIYNSLSAISTLISIDPEKAQRSLDDFTEYLRRNLSSLTETKLIPFKTELKHIETYISLEKMRFSGVRPDHISVLNGVGIGVVGLVEVSELMGPSVHLHLNVSGNDVIVIVPTLGGVVDYVGKNIKIQFSGELVNLFSKENERNLEYIDEEDYHVDESTSLYKSISKDDDDVLVDIPTDTPAATKTE